MKNKEMKVKAMSMAVAMSMVAVSYTHLDVYKRQIDGCGIDEKDKLLEDGYDLKEIGSKLVDNYIKQVMDDGFFHADPHSGNVKIRDGKIVWIDMEMCIRDRVWILDERKWIWDGILPDLVCIGCIAWRMRSNYISGWMGKTSDVDDVDIKGNTACICSFLCDYRRMHYQSDACEGR